MANRINNPDYLFYVIRNGRIHSGWERISDGLDQKAKLKKDRAPGTVVCYTKQYSILFCGLDPDKNENWKQRECSECKGHGSCKLVADNCSLYRDKSYQEREAT